MDKLVDAWNSIWLAAESASRLATCRILSLAAVIWLVGRHDFSVWGEIDNVLWTPIWFFKWWNIPQPSAGHLLILQWIWRVSLIASLFGLFTRFSTLTAWLVGVYLLGMINCFGKVSHSQQLIVMILGVLAFSRCGDTLSLDAWIRNRLRRESPSRLKSSSDYGWPIRAVWLAFIAVFFAAGVAKLRDSGLEWVFSDNLANTIRKAYYGVETTNTGLGLVVVKFPLLCQAMAACGLVLELASPIALVSRVARPWIIGGLFGMQIGISLLMGVNFSVFTAAYVFWVPWDTISDRCKRLLMCDNLPNT